MPIWKKENRTEIAWGGDNTLRQINCATLWITVVSVFSCQRYQKQLERNDSMYLDVHSWSVAWGLKLWRMWSYKESRWLDVCRFQEVCLWHLLGELAVTSSGQYHLSPKHTFRIITMLFKQSKNTRFSFSQVRNTNFSKVTKLWNRITVPELLISLQNSSIHKSIKH